MMGRPFRDAMPARGGLLSGDVLARCALGRLRRLPGASPATRERGTDCQEREQSGKTGSDGQRADAGCQGEAPSSSGRWPDPRLGPNWGFTAAVPDARLGACQSQVFLNFQMCDLTRSLRKPLVEPSASGARREG